MLQFTAAEMLASKKGPKRHAWMSLGKENRKDFLGKLGADENMRDWDGRVGEGWKRRIIKEMS